MEKLLYKKNNYIAKSDYIEGELGVIKIQKK